MNTKVLLGFLAGVLAASGVYFVTSHHKSEPAVEAAPAATVAQVPEPPAPAPAEAPVAAAPPAPVQAPIKAHPKKAAVTPPAPKPVEPPPAPVTVAEVAPVEVPKTEPAPVAELAPPPPPAPAAAPEPPPPPAPAPAPEPEPRQPRSVTLTAGTLLTVRLSETLSSDRNQAGDTFQAVLDQPLVIDNLVIAEKGSRVTGRIRDIEEAGRVKGLSRMVLELTNLNTSDGQNILIRTEGFERKGPESKEEDVKKVGAGAAIGAIIGAIAGGGKGAAIGAAAGGAAGGGVVAATRGKPAVLESETRISFRVDQPVTITEKL
jgi:hypothetical protein